MGRYAAKDMKVGVKWGLNDQLFVAYGGYNSGLRPV
jgi:hypothetical protein